MGGRVSRAQGPKPFLRWAGGKAKFAAQFAPMVQFLTHGRIYVEPFVGGGAMFFAVQPEEALLNDTNVELMTTYEAVKNNATAVADALVELRAFGVDETSYYQVRETLPENQEEIAARFIYLNKTCFNGLYRVNRDGLFNVPYGKLTSPAIPTLHELTKVQNALANAHLRSQDAVGIIGAADETTFLYVDPPYDGTYDGYTENGFSWDDQTRLAEALKESAALFLAHNANTERVTKLYSWAHVMPVAESWSVAARAQDRATSKCLLITR